jgi:hypothetical protein
LLLVDAQDPLKDSDDECGRPAEQDDAVRRLERGEQAPFLAQADVSVAERRERDEREVERLLEIFERSLPEVEGRPKPCLEDGRERHREDQRREHRRVREHAAALPIAPLDRADPMHHPQRAQEVDEGRSEDQRGRVR